MSAQSLFLTLVERFSDITPLIPYYHVISDKSLPHIRHVHPYKRERQFIQDVDFLSRRYHPITLNELIDYARHGKEFTKRSFIITFDDGYSQIHSVVAPILWKKGLPAIFFLTSDFVDNRKLSCSNKASLIIDSLHQERGISPVTKQALLNKLNVSEGQLFNRILSISYNEAPLLDDIALLLNLDLQGYLSNEKPYLTSLQIQELIKMGFYFGAHSTDHPYFKDLPMQDQIHQAVESLAFVKKQFGLSYSFFAFPHSDYFIERDFFNKTKGVFDLTFGTCGIKKDPISTNLQRINFERTQRPASNILLRQLIKKIVYAQSDRMIINRDASV